MSNLTLRIISAIVLLAIVLPVTWYGGVGFRILAAVTGLACLHEWLEMHKGRIPRALELGSWAVMLVAAAAIVMDAPALSTGGYVVLAAVAFGVAGSVLAKNWASGIGLAYAGLPALAIAKLRGADAEGFAVVLFLFAAVWATDILAYFTGRAIGGPKLAPSISPGKTWSGAIGGAAGGVLAAWAVAAAFGKGGDWRLPLIALAVSILSQIGDLYESSVKRRAGVKDSSRLIPGHGGVLDRVDGLVAGAVLLYLIGAIAAGPDSPAQGIMGAITAH